MRDGKKSVLIINGPNLNLLGNREPHIYGHETLTDVENNGRKQAEMLNAHVDFLQRLVKQDDMLLVFRSPLIQPYFQ